MFFVLAEASRLEDAKLGEMPCDVLSFIPFGLTKAGNRLGRIWVEETEKRTVCQRIVWMQTRCKRKERKKEKNSVEVQV